MYTYKGLNIFSASIYLCKFAEDKTVYDQHLKVDKAAIWNGITHRHYGGNAVEAGEAKRFQEIMADTFRIGGAACIREVSAVP